MKNTKHIAILTACMVSLLALPAYADQTTNANSQDVDQLIKKINGQTASLQAEVKELKSEVAVLKQQQARQHTSQQMEQEEHMHLLAESEAYARHLQATEVGLSTNPARNSTGTSVQPNGARPVENVMPEALPQSFFSGLPVYTSAYVGDHTAFDPSALVIYYPTYNEDLHLLQQRQTLYNQFDAAGVPPPANPFLQISGKLEGQAIYTKPSFASHTSDISLATSELDFIPVINDWASGFAAIAYDNSLAPNTPLTSNSRIFLDQGFLTIGNLNAAPVYGTLGQMYVPFGAYLSNMITDPLTEDLGQIKARALLLGYQEHGNQGLYAQAFTYNGEANLSANNNTVNSGGANLGYMYNGANWNFDLGASGDANIADSIFMQDTLAPSSLVNGNPAFSGFGEVNDDDVIHKRVPAYDLHGSVGVGNWGLVAEYLHSTTDFDTQDLTFDGHGAEPSALNVELSYNFPTYGRPSAITVGYGQSKQALALLIPEQRFIAVYNISIWKDTVEAIEFRHDINYKAQDTATGNGLPINFEQGGGNSLGGSVNAVTFQTGIYF